MKKKIIIILLIISLGVNIYFGGKWLLFERGYEPTVKEETIMSEMIVKTINSDDYKKIAAREKVIAIDRGIDKYKGGVFPYNMGVSVRTNKQTYLFFCDDEQCSALSEPSTTYSMYQDEDPILPLEK